MSRNIAVRLQSDPGWKVVSYAVSDDGSVRLSLHHVGGWALEGFPGKAGNVHLTGLPTSLNGDVLSDLPNFLGIIAPEDDLEERLEAFRASVRVSYGPPEASEPRAVISG